MISPSFQARLAGGATTLCRAWALTRRDGVVMGFTDHDRAIAFEGIAFRPDSGMTARALSQTTGLSVDNSEAVGALSDAAITEADILAGRFDGAGIRIWLVDWRDPAQRLLQFSGSLGEISRADGGFSAELRGLTEALNQPRGQVYQKRCSAVLGDARCRFDLGQPGYAHDLAAELIEGARLFRFAGLDQFAPRWFEAGRLIVTGGSAAGLSGIVKNDRHEDGVRVIELWQGLRAEVAAGDMLRLEAGCDKRAETCRVKFANMVNFQGFPHLPGEDWLIAAPAQVGAGDGGA